MQTEKQREKSHVAARVTAATGLSIAQRERKCNWQPEEPQCLWAAAVEDQARPPGRCPCPGPLRGVGDWSPTGYKAGQATASEQHKGQHWTQGC